jgi:hypothetical protein
MAGGEGGGGGNKGYNVISLDKEFSCVPMYVSWRNQGLIKEISKLGWGMATPGPNEALLVPRGLEFRCDAKQIDMQLETLIQIQGITFAEVYRC